MTEVGDMVLLVFSVVLAGLATVGLGLSWLDWHARRRRADHDPHPITTPPPDMDAAAADRDGEREEISLARNLIAGHLTPARYHQLIADLAAHDAPTHPVVVPPDGVWPA